MDIEDQRSELFFGDPNNAVFLARAPKSLNYEFKEGDIIDLRNNYTIAQALKNKNPLSYLGPEYKSLYVPCIPAIEYSVNNFFSKLKECSNSDSTNLLDQGFVKIPESKDAVRAIKSGKRSAVIKWTDGKHYRLKGCGNLDVGFVTDAMQADDPDAREIRGSHYYHTALNELHMTEVISKIFKPYQIVCANKSKGLWLYKEVESLGLKEESKLVDKYCAVFETLGEKRLATHLLQGLEILLHNVVKNFKTLLRPESIDELFPTTRIDPDPVTKLPTINPTGWCIPLLDIPEGKSIHEWTQNPVYSQEENEKLVDLNATLQKESLKSLRLCGDDAKYVLSLVAEHYKSDPEKAKLIVNLAEEFGKTGVDFFSSLTELYSRIGSESGIIKKILQDNDINWGFYMDHHHLVSHCNAHPNNLAVLPQGASRFLLGPLDFDLSFPQKNFINIDLLETPEKYGTHDIARFENFLNNERYNLELALSGFENMVNFSYSGVTLDPLEEDKKRIYEGLKVALRDTLILAYRRGYDQLQTELKSLGDISTWSHIYPLIKIALILTSTANC